MSSYDLNRFLFDLKMNNSTLKEARADLEKAMNSYALSLDEKHALREKNPKQLTQLGAHGMLALWIMQLDPEFEKNIYWTQK